MNYHGDNFYLISAIPVSDLPTEGDGAMSNEAWLAARQGDFKNVPVTDEFAAFVSDHPIDYTIAASEAGAVLNVSPWKTAHELFDEKKGRAPKEELTDEKKALFKRGHVFEEPIRNLAAEEVEKVFGEGSVTVWPDKRMFVSRERPNILCDPDGFITLDYDDGDGRKHYNGYLEIKTVSRNATKIQKAWQEGVISPTYEAQCRHAMYVFGADFALIIGAWGFDEDCRAWKIIWRDKGKERELLEKEDEFLDSLRNDVPPLYEPVPVLESAYYARLYGETTDETVDIPDAYRDDVLKLYNVDLEIQKQEEALKELQDEREAAINSLYPVFKDAGCGKMEDGGMRYVISCKAGKHRRAFDFKRLEKERPDVYKEVIRETPSLDKDKSKAFTEVLSAYWTEGKPNGTRTWRLVTYDVDGETVSDVKTSVKDSTEKTVKRKKKAEKADPDDLFF